MIKINLLGAPKPKRGKRAATATTMVDMGGGGGGGMNPIVLIVLALLIGGGVVGYGYMRAQSEAADIANKIKQADQENRRLAAVKAKFDQEQKVKENYEQRVKVIDDLRTEQNGKGNPVNLLTMIGDTVNSTDAVWLNSMQDNGSNIVIKGSALSANAVANLVNNLQKTGYFKSVQMNNAAQDASAKDVETFDFDLTCEKQS